MRWLRVLLFVFVSSLLLTSVHSKVLKKTFKTKSNFAFISRFCYDTAGNGTAEFTVYSPSGNSELMMLYYSDVYENNWMNAYRGKGLTCEERSALAMASQSVVLNSETSIAFEDVRREHYWYFAISNCDQSGGMEFTIDLHMFNYGNNLWTKEFSYDEQGLEALYLFWFLVYLIGVSIHGYGIWVFVRARSYHTLVRLLSSVIGTQFVSVLCMFIHYAVYATNGVGVPGLHVIGNILDIFGQVVFILLIVLIASGWAISKSTLSNRRQILIITGFLLAAYFGLFIWEVAGFDAASTLYVYDSPPGIIVIVIRLLAMAWFMNTLRITFMEENHPTKRRFYLYFGIFYLAWFLCLPLITLIAVGIDPWVRMKAVISMYVTSNALAFALLAFLFWPTRVSEYFQISSHLDISGTIPYDSI